MSGSDLNSLDDVLNNIGFGKFNYVFILISGVYQACDAMEMLILAFLGPLLRCYWRISVIEESFLTTVVFIGMLFGGPILGRMCDYFGRKSILSLTTILLAYIGLLSAASPTMVWIYIFRGIIGACLGGIMSSLSTLISEVTLTKYRGRTVIIIFGFWTLGGFFITGICAAVANTLGWQIFLIISTIPLLVLLPSLWWVPESPRYLLLKGCKEKALKVINKIAKLNGADVVKDIETPSSKSTHSKLDLFHPNYCWTTVLCIIIWFIVGFSYYGIVLLITMINSVPHRCLQNMSQMSKPLGVETSDSSCCIKLNWDTFRETLISLVGELVFIPINSVVIDIIGRKATMGIFSFINAALYFVLNFCMPPLALHLCLFILRGCLSSTFTSIYLYATEVFPTSVRSSGVGICNGSARIGAMIAPFIVNMLLLEINFLMGTMIFTFVNLVMLACVLLLPYETLGRQLYQTAEHSNDQVTKSEYIEVK